MTEIVNSTVELIIEKKVSKAELKQFKLRDRLIGASIDKNSSIMTDSTIFNDTDACRTRVPILNLALSGSLDGGLSSGLTMIAGPSKHFKSNLALIMIAAYLRKYKDAVCVFFDNEFGTTPAYFQAAGIDPNRVIHAPFMNIEELKFDVVKKLEEVKRGDRVVFYIDSVGNAASKKEIDDAKDEKSVSDMTRAKQLKSLFRMVTPYLTMLDVPLVCINHTYNTMELYAKTVMSGGTGGMYSADTVIIIGRQQEKDGKELLGYNFMLKAEKSRYIREGSVLPLNVSFEGGINTFSGLLAIAQELGFVVKPKNGWYQRAFVDSDSGEFVVAEDERLWREADTESVEFWKSIMAHQPFKDAVENRYKLKALSTSDAAYDEMAELFGD